MSKQKIDHKHEKNQKFSNINIILTKLFHNKNNKYCHNLIFENKKEYENIGQIWKGKIMNLFYILIDIIKEKKKNEVSLSDFNKYLSPQEDRLENIIIEIEKIKSVKTKNKIIDFLKNIPYYLETNKKQNERTYEIYNWFADTLLKILSEEKEIYTEEKEKCFDN